jgi:hypothetical protein
MPELRQSVFPKVIIATERAQRPEELATHGAAQPAPVFVESRAYCPGNESEAPSEVLRSPAAPGDLNYALRRAPAEHAGARHFHRYLSVTPRLMRVAGFELGSGMSIDANRVLPEAAADFLARTGGGQIGWGGAGQ